MPQEDEMVTFRLGPKDRAAIQKLVDDGEFRNRSDFLRYAVKSTLKDADRSHPKARVDLEMEGIDLPQGDAARARTHRSRRGVNL